MSTAITASMVKELRETTGSPMMDCKKALTENSGDIEASIEWLRKNGLAKADKRSARVAAEGVIAMGQADGFGMMIEVNSETDFVAKDDNFVAFVNELLAQAISHKVTTVDALMQLPSTVDSGKTMEERRCALGAKVGENVQVRRIDVQVNSSGCVAGYQHGTRIGVLVSLDVDNQVLAKDICMHIAATNPAAITEADVDPQILANEKEIYKAQAEQSGKPADIVEKMVLGRVKKFLKENTLLGQGFVRDSDQSVKDLLAKHKANVLSFVRYEVGEGIEVESKNFADEVMEQLK